MAELQTDDATSNREPLSLIQQRILGVLIEKQKTTPDVYPMTVNALVAGCNQKSNRDPVLALGTEDIDSTLEELNNKGLVIRVMSGRTDKWKHVLYEHWSLDKVELAILAELFLRGPQTEGELRGRVSRMEPIDSLETLRTLLRGLKERGFVVYLTPEGRRGTAVAHALQDGALIEQFRRDFSEGGQLGSSTSAPDSLPGARRGEPSAELAELRKELAELRLSVEALSEQVKNLQEQLGVPRPTLPS